VWEGAIQHSAVKRFELGGQDLTALLARQLSESNPNVSLDLSTVQMLKEKYAEVPEDQSDYDSSAEACPSVEHTLPDGQVHKVSMFKCKKCPLLLLTVALCVGLMERRESNCCVFELTSFYLQITGNLNWKREVYCGRGIIPPLNIGY
jgi:actin-related protein